MKERDVQIAIGEWIRETYPNWIVFAVCNEACYKRVNYYKAMGMLPGSPDLVVLGNEVYLLEVKAEYGRQRPEQRLFEMKSNVLGYKYKIVLSLDDVKELFGYVEFPTEIKWEV